MTEKQSVSTEKKYFQGISFILVNKFKDISKNWNEIKKMGQNSIKCKLYGLTNLYFFTPYLVFEKCKLLFLEHPVGILPCL